MRFRAVDLVRYKIIINFKFLNMRILDFKNIYWARHLRVHHWVSHSTLSKPEHISLSNVWKAQLLTSIPNKLTKDDKTEVFSLMPKWWNTGKSQKLNYRNHITIFPAFKGWYSHLVFWRERKKKTAVNFLIW